MPTTILSQPLSVQQLFDRVSLLPLNPQQRLIAWRIIALLKDDELRSLEQLITHDESLAKKLIANAVKLSEKLSVNNEVDIINIIADNAALLSS